MKRIYLLMYLCSLFAFKSMSQTQDLITNRNAYAMAINGNDLYYTMYTQGSIAKVDLTDPNLTESIIITGLNQPIGLVFNGNELFISELAGSKISKIDITDSTPILTTVISGPKAYGMAIRGNQLYFTKFNNGIVSRLDITETNPTEANVISGLSEPIDLLFNNNDLYISELGNTRISKVDVTDPTLSLSTVLNGPRAYGMRIFNNELYYTQYNNDRVVKINLNDSNPAINQIVTGVSEPVDVLFYGNDLIISEIGTSKIVSYQNPTLSIPLYQHNDKIYIFPNPSSGFVKLKGLKENACVKIYDMAGKLVGIYESVLKQSIDVSRLNKGMYNIIVEQNDKQQHVKFIRD